MVSVHRVHTHERDDMCSRAEMSSESITQLTARTANLEEQYEFFQETRGYVRDLVECLNEKVGPSCILPTSLCFFFILYLSSSYVLLSCCCTLGEVKLC